MSTEIYLFSSWVMSRLNCDSIFVLKFSEEFYVWFDFCFKSAEESGSWAGEGVIMFYSTCLLFACLFFSLKVPRVFDLFIIIGLWWTFLLGELWWISADNGLKSLTFYGMTKSVFYLIQKVKFLHSLSELPPGFNILRSPKPWFLSIGLYISLISLFVCLLKFACFFIYSNC